MESVFSGTLIQKMTKFPHGDNFYGDPDITSKNHYHEKIATPCGNIQPLQLMIVVSNLSQLYLASDSWCWSSDIA